MKMRRNLKKPDLFFISKDKKEVINLIRPLKAGNGPCVQVDSEHEKHDLSLPMFPK